MTDSVCTAYESRKQRNDSSSTIKGIVFITTKYVVYIIYLMSMFKISCCFTRFRKEK